MSFIIAVHVNEGIVLASDRRTTYNNSEKCPDGTIIHYYGIHTTDSTDKTFICPNGAGISTCGGATLNGKPLSSYISEFIRNKVSQSTPVSSVPTLLIDFFSQLSSDLDTSFYVAGYEEEDNKKVQKIYNVNLLNSNIETIDTSSQGAAWNGITSILERLITPVALKKDDGSYVDLINEDILWQFFTLQDAVDFSRYSVETTINTMRFKSMIETVGGNIDILLITPEETRWIQKEELS